MTDERTTHEPNTEGFGGDPTTPEPDRGSDTPGAESIAVPADDLTGPASDALESVAGEDNDNR
jgi:hypothetical protein